MKKLFTTVALCGLCICLGTTVLGQDVKTSDTYKMQKDVYNLGIKYGDVNAARNALFTLIALDPNDYSLLDSLAYLYFDYQRHTSVILVCRDILSRDPNNLAAIEMSAISFENLSLKDKALEQYESLNLKNDNIYTLYKIAVLQLDLGRYVESNTNIGILLKNEEAQTAKIDMNTEQGPKEIQLKAAVYNLKGLLEDRQGQKEAAKASFNEALKLEPDFTMAKNNLEDLDK